MRRDLRIFTVMVVAVVLPLMAHAARVSVSEAQRLASNFVGQNSATMMRGVDSELELAYKSAGDELYVFSAVEGTGYVLVAGDDCLPAILGYSDTGVFRADAIPENMQAWINDYAAAIKYVQAHPEVKLKASTSIGSKAGNVYPLLGEIKWNQSSPYNLLAPSYTSGSYSYQCVTGCVATAMAQIMRYHQHPAQGTGSHSYDCTVNSDTSNVQTLSVDFSQSVYDWENMLPTYSGSETDDQKSAVAKLMYDCGVSVDMKYGSSSGAATQQVLASLAGYFGYDKGAGWYTREDYLLQDWLNIIDAELLAARPILHAGFTPKGGGHAFVLDGCNSSGYYHFNWGWGGSSNGYFVITDLSPSLQGIGSSEGGYNLDQGIAIGIQPDKGNAVAYSTHLGTFTCSTESVALGNYASFTWKNYRIMMTQIESMKAYFGIGLYDTDGNYVKQLTNSSMSGLKPGYYYLSRTWSATIPTGLSEGTYYIRPNYAPYGTSEYKLMDVSQSTNQYIQMTVTGDSAIFSTPDNTPNLQIDTLSVAPDSLEAGQKVLVSAKIRNLGQEYHGNVYLAISEQSETGVGTPDDPVTTSGSKMIVVPEDGSTTLELTITAPSTEGTYVIDVMDENGNAISNGSTTITIGSATASYSLSTTNGLVLASSKVPKTHLEGTATIKNSGGTFSGQLGAMIIDASTSIIVKRVYSDFVTIASGETKQVAFNADFTGGTAGNQYRIKLFYPKPATTSTNILFGPYTTFTLIDPVHGDVNADGVCDVTDATVLISNILGLSSTPFDQNEADMNGDGKADVADITSIIYIILGQ